MRVKNEDYAFLVKPWSKSARRYYTTTFGSAFKGESKLPLKPFEDVYNKPSHVIYNSLQKVIEDSSFVVVDVTLGLPNVYWEYGYALAMGKPILLVRRRREDAQSLSKLDEFISNMPASNKEGQQCKTLLKDIAARYYGIPSDTQGVLYNDAPEKFTETSKRSIGKVITQAFEQAYNRGQTCSVSRTQFQKYLDCGDRKEPFLFYCSIDLNNRHVQDCISHLLEEVSLIGEKDVYLVLNFRGDKEFNYDQFKNVIMKCRSVRVTPRELSSDMVLLGEGVAYFFDDGQPIRFIRFGQDKHFTKRLCDSLLRSGIVVGCVRMLERAAEIQSSLGLKHVDMLNDDGFAFESFSGLSFADPQHVLTHVTVAKQCDALFDKLRSNDLKAFNAFTDLTLKDTQYVMAFWPLTDDSLKLAEKKDVNEWLKRLDKWAQKRLSHIGTPIHRFFVIPESEFRGGHFVNTRYLQKVIDFFNSKFRLEKCSYKRNVFIVFDTPDVRTRLFGRDDPKLILRQNAILFSNRRFSFRDIERNVFNAIFQFESIPPVEHTINGKKRSLLTLRYLKFTPEVVQTSKTANKFARDMQCICREIRGTLPRVGNELAIMRATHLIKNIRRFK